MKLAPAALYLACVLPLAGCGSHAEAPALDPVSARRATESSVDRAPANVELSHVYLLSPGQDAVRVVVSR